MSLAHKDPECGGVWRRTYGRHAGREPALFCTGCWKVHPATEANEAAASDENLPKVRWMARQGHYIPGRVNT